MSYRFRYRILLINEFVTLDYIFFGDKTRRTIVMGNQCNICEGVDDVQRDQFLQANIAESTLPEPKKELDIEDQQNDKQLKNKYSSQQKQAERVDKENMDPTQAIKNELNDYQRNGLKENG